MTSGPGTSLAAEIGRAYDIVPYDGGTAPALRLPELRGAVAALGFEPSPGPVLDVLDIGCGAGGQLFEAAQASPGRMVGIDASAESCARAAARGAGLGPRWRILHGDAAAMDGAALGTFDVVYLVGTAYLMPSPARAATLGLLARCLKPGGIAVITGYAGLFGLARARLARILNLGNDAARPPLGQVELARANLRVIASVLPAQGAALDLARATLASFETAEDVVLFHEVTSPVFDPLHAGELEAALAPHGLAYLNHLPPLAVTPGTGSAAAAGAADAWDFATGGGYRTMLFTRPGARGPGRRHPRVVWTPALLRAPGGEGFTDPMGRTNVNPNTPWARAQLEALLSGAGTWHQLRVAALSRLGAPLPGPGLEGAFDAELDEILATLWRQGMVQPALAEPG